MPRFEPNPANVTASLEVLEKGDYELVVGEPKSFLRQNQKGQDSYGVRYQLVVAEGPKKGAKVFLSCYQHTDGGQQMSKAFMMAAMGYKNTPADEKRFDSDTAGKDWSFDTDSGACGDMWRGITGHRVTGSLDVQINKDTGDQMQQYKSWRPIS